MLGAQFNSRWKHQYKPGQPVACRILAKVADGYTVEFGTERITGHLPTRQQIAPGTQLLLQFLGYKNQVPSFNASYGLAAYASIG